MICFEENELLWDMDIKKNLYFLSELEQDLIINYFEMLKKQVYFLIDNISYLNFYENLSILIGIDRKLQLLFEFLNPKDLKIVDNKIEKLISLIEEEYIIYHHEQLCTASYPLNKYSLLYKIQ